MKLGNLQLKVLHARIFADHFLKCAVNMEKTVPYSNTNRKRLSIALIATTIANIPMNPHAAVKLMLAYTAMNITFALMDW